MPTNRSPHPSRPSRRPRRVTRRVPSCVRRPVTPPTGAAASRRSTPRSRRRRQPRATWCPHRSPWLQPRRRPRLPRSRERPHCGRDVRHPADGTPAPIIALFDDALITLPAPCRLRRRRPDSNRSPWPTPTWPGTVQNLLTINPAVPLSVGVRVVELTSVRFPEESEILCRRNGARPGGQHHDGLRTSRRSSSVTPIRAPISVM